MLREGNEDLHNSYIASSSKGPEMRYLLIGTLGEFDVSGGIATGSFVLAMEGGVNVQSHYAPASFILIRFAYFPTAMNVYSLQNTK